MADEPKIRKIVIEITDPFVAGTLAAMIEAYRVDLTEASKTPGIAKWARAIAREGLAALDTIEAQMKRAVTEDEETKG